MRIILAVVEIISINRKDCHLQKTIQNTEHTTSIYENSDPRLTLQSIFLSYYFSFLYIQPCLFEGCSKPSLDSVLVALCAGNTFDEVNAGTIFEEPPGARRTLQTAERLVVRAQILGDDISDVVRHFQPM